jgi:uncharacterized protein (DUF362 family)
MADMDGKPLDARRVAVIAEDRRSSTFDSVKAAFAQAFDCRDAPNPLTSVIEPGQSVFVLPNFVVHRRKSESELDFSAKVTQVDVLEAVLRLAIDACGDPRLVKFGNSPLQGCDLEQLDAAVGVTPMIDRLRDSFKAAPEWCDLRQVRTVWSSAGTIKSVSHHEVKHVSFDVGTESHLEEFYSSGTAPTFRVGDYPPEVTASFHAPGHHVYRMSHDVLSAAVVISVPKLKTHQKVGITCALKGIVGTITRKECLAHARSGGPATGGDEYAHDSLTRSAITAAFRRADSAKSLALGNLFRLSAKVGFFALRRTKQAPMGGAWFGNDTCWRMTLDINRLLRYGRPDGTIATEPQRQHVVLVDGIVAGEGDGPLRPRAVAKGVLIAGADAPAVDVVCAAVMGFDWRSMPMLDHAFDIRPRPLSAVQAADICVVLGDGSFASVDAVADEATRFVPPPGWQGVLDRERQTH